MYRLFGKRLFDVTIASLALVVCSPLLVAIATAIRLEDGGPILFRQLRPGKAGRLFPFLKFRSMPVGTQELPSSQARGLRLTRVGKVIRRVSFDELPQLFNILRGEMSIVGPRPPLPVQEELLRLREDNGAIDCLPGLTGLAQVNGYDGMPVPEKARWDGIYSRNVSFLQDMKIILRTVRYILRPPPVY